MTEEEKRNLTVGFTAGPKNSGPNELFMLLMESLAMCGIASWSELEGATEAFEGHPDGPSRFYRMTVEEVDASGNVIPFDGNKKEHTNV